MTFNELARRLEQGGFRIVREKGSVRYYGKPGRDKLCVSIIMGVRKFQRELAMRS